jgi:hypothetical protein
MDFLFEVSQRGDAILLAGKSRVPTIARVMIARLPSC